MTTWNKKDSWADTNGMFAGVNWNNVSTSCNQQQNTTVWAAHPRHWVANGCTKVVPVTNSYLGTDASTNGALGGNGGSGMVRIKFIQYV
jgi:hypothetical protein